MKEYQTLLIINKCNMVKKKFGQTRVGKTIKKVATAPVRMVKNAIKKEKAYDAYKAKKFRDEMMNSL